MVRIVAAIVIIGILGPGVSASEPSELTSLCKQKRSSAIAAAEQKAQQPGVDPTCLDLIKLSKEKCDKSPEDPGFKSAPKGAGSPELVKTAAAANQKTADSYRDHGRDCGRVRDELGQDGLCRAKFEELTSKFREVTARRDAAIGKPEYTQLHKEYEQAKAAVQATHEARIAALESASISAECDGRFAQAYQQATDDLLKNYLPLVAADDPFAGTTPTAGGNPDDPKREGGPTAEKRAAGAVARTAAAYAAKEAGLGALAKKGFAGLTVATCAKGDAIGCAVGATQTAIDYSVKQPWRYNPYAAAVGIALTPTPTAGPCQSQYFHSPIDAGYAGCGFRSFSVESLNHSIQLLEQSK